MSLVSSGLVFTHRCVIERDANAATTNGRGNPNPPDWQPLASDVHCRAWVTAGRERDVNDAIVPVSDLRMLFALGTDVSEADQIRNVTERGQTIFPGPLGIRAVLSHHDHIELVLKRIG